MTTSDFVAGRWRECQTGLGFGLEDPATGAVAGPALASPPERVEAALAAAAASRWGSCPVEERIAALEAIADRVEAVAPSIVDAEVRQTGVPIRQAQPLGIILSGAFRLAAAQLREGWLSTTVTREDGRQVRVERLGWGPAVCLVPFNAPAPMAAHKVANALAAGCPTILKPSELAPLGTQLLAAEIAEVAGDAFQLVHGGAAEGGRLVSDPRVRAVSFTGGLAGGRAVASACAHDIKPAQLELGGNNPLVVMPDADPEQAARAAVDLLTTLNGQWCRALGRLILPARSAADIMECVAQRLAGLRAGAPLDPEVDLGPLIHSRHRARVMAARDALGGTVLGPTVVPGEGNYLAPAIVSGVDPMRTKEEIFGPVAAMHTYTTIDEAVELANGTPYGLEGYVFGGDEHAALAVAGRIRAGEVKVNGSSVMSLHLFTPRPAWGLSGTGEEGTAETLRFFTNPRVIGVEGGFALHTRP